MRVVPGGPSPGSRDARMRTVEPARGNGPVEARLRRFRPVVVRNQVFATLPDQFTLDSLLSHKTAGEKPRAYHRQIVARWSKEGRIRTEGAMVAARAPSQRAWPSACRGRIPRPAWNFAALLRDRLSHRIGASTPWGAGKCRVCATAGMCSVARPRRESPYPSVGPSGLWQDRITTLSMPPSAPPGSGRREHQDGAVGQEERPERVLHEAEAANMTPDECRLFSQVGAQVKR